MKPHRVLPLIMTGLLLAGGASSVAARQVDAIKMLDTDNDGTIDLEEAKKAAAAQFAKLDTDHEGTLDARELRGRLTAKALKAADPDKDGTLTMDEYLAIVTQRFNAANKDNDGTLDANEMKTSAGRALLQLLK
jgi:Ca2+-binding EF-hand superfamily protein